MSPGRRKPSQAAKRALLAGAALAMLWSGAAHAQRTDKGEVLSPPTPPPPAPTPAPGAQAAKAPPPADGLAPEELYMEADQVIRDDQAKTTTAEGNVEIRYQGRTLRADRLIYQETPGVIRARGHVQIINPDGTVEYGDDFTFDEKMVAGVAMGFSARLGQNVKLAGATAVRRNENIQELNRAIYTPCEVCTADGKPKTPTWSVSADRIVQDKKRRIIYYRNARIHVLGVPVLYLPVFWHADPSAERASGLLAPRMSASGRRGFSYEQPYLWVLSPYSDLTISPQINTKVNPFLNARLRKRFYSGSVDMRFGYTYDRDYDGQGHKFGTLTSRSYILGRGAFRIDENWRWGFTAEHTSDKLIFDKYEIGDVYEARGPYVADDRRLISEAYVVRQDRRSFASAAAMTIQGLRPGDIDRTFPLVAPLVESHFDVGQIAGGRLRLNASGVALTRDQSPTSPLLPGIDSRRATAEVEWRRTFTSQGGLRVAPFINLRADAYSLSNVSTGVGTQLGSRTVSRGLGVAGADISYPLYRRWRDATLVLEPLAQIAVSPKAQQIVVGKDAAGKPIYLNEDSVAFEFDETTLFRVDKFPGYDLYEGGARLNVAGRATALWDDGRRASVLVGRSFRDTADPVFTARSGLRNRASDWIVAADAQPVRGVSFFGRARLDSTTLSVRRAEAGLNLSSRWASGYARYLTDVLDINGNKQENFDLGGEVYVTKNWGVTAYGNRDLRQQAWVIRDVGVFYKDDCMRVDLIYRKEDVILGRLGPTESVALRLTLATLGGPLYAR